MTSILTSKIKNISGIQRRQFSIVRSLILGPSIILAGEATKAYNRFGVYDIGQSYTFPTDGPSSFHLHAHRVGFMPHYVLSL